MAINLEDAVEAHLIMSLVGEGGGLKLYCHASHGALRFAWDGEWQLPDEKGVEPVKSQGWKSKMYLSTSDAIDDACGYWILLAPVFVREDYRNLIWQIVSGRLARSCVPAPRLADRYARWWKVCHEA